MYISEKGFANAALGFIVFGLLMGFIIVSNNTVPSSSEETVPMLSQESSRVPKSSTKPSSSFKASASPLSSSTTQPSNSPSPSSSASATNTETAQSEFIKITSPNGGESYKIGQTLNITWEYKDVSDCQIRYVTENNTKSALFLSADVEKKSYQLPLSPLYLGELESAKLKIDLSCIKNDKSTISDQSDTFFTLSQ
jgi:hypothetical protein